MKYFFCSKVPFKSTYPPICAGQIFTQVRVRKDNKAGSAVKLKEQADQYEASSKRVNYETNPEFRNNFPEDNNANLDIEQTDSDFNAASSSKTRDTDRQTRQDADKSFEKSSLTIFLQSLSDQAVKSSIQTS